MMRSSITSSGAFAGLLTVLCIALGVAPARAIDCAGDCSGDGAVTINEVLVGVKDGAGGARFAWGPDAKAQEYHLNTVTQKIYLRETNPTPLTAEDLRLIRQELLRMERTVQGLLDYARTPPPDRRRHDLRALIDEASATMRKARHSVPVAFGRRLEVTR